MKRLFCGALIAACLTLPLTGCLETLLIGGAATAGAVVLSDRRSVSTYSTDAWINIKASTPLGEVGSGKDSHIIANVFNGRVLLTGQVATDADKQAATDAAKGVSGVTAVDNQLTVGPTTPLEVRSADSVITSKIKGRLTAYNAALGNAMKVITENGTAYVYGILTQGELDHGIEIVRTTSGVQRVVRTGLITVIQETQAKALDQEAKDDASKAPSTITPTQPTTQPVN